MSYSPVRERAEADDAERIEACRNDPEFMATGMCPVCVMDRPCICDSNAAVKKMREWYEANKAIYRASFFGKLIETRAEPIEHLNWGEKGDGLMRGLYRIARDQILEAQKEARGQKCSTR